MLPITQSSLVSRMYATPTTRGKTAELVRYVRSEYGVNEPFAEEILRQVRHGASPRRRNGTDGWFRRLLAAAAETFAGLVASPGGA